jgi:hypothetical protein
MWWGRRVLRYGRRGGVAADAWTVSMDEQPIVGFLCTRIIAASGFVYPMCGFFYARMWLSWICRACMHARHRFLKSLLASILCLLLVRENIVPICFTICRLVLWNNLRVSCIYEIKFLDKLLTGSRFILVEPYNQLAWIILQWLRESQKNRLIHLSRSGAQR